MKQAFVNARLVDPESGYDGPGCLVTPPLTQCPCQEKNGAGLGGSLEYFGRLQR